MKIIKNWIWLAVIFSLGSSAHAQQLDAEQQRQIKVEIKELVDNYGYYRDHFMAEEFANLFAEDGKAIDGEKSWQGRDALRARVDAVSRNRLTMHVMGTSHIEIIDANHARGVHYGTIYAKTLEQGREQSEIISMDGIYLVAKYLDEYILTSEGWKFAVRDIDRVFTSAN